MEATRTYDTRLDSKRRLTIRGASFEYYHVEEYSDGRIILEPRVLTPPFEVSERTLAMMDSGIKNFRKGQVSAPVDLTEFISSLSDDAVLSTEANPDTEANSDIEANPVTEPEMRRVCAAQKSVESNNAEVRP